MLLDNIAVTFNRDKKDKLYEKFNYKNFNFIPYFRGDYIDVFRVYISE